MFALNLIEFKMVLAVDASWLVMLWINVEWIMVVWWACLQVGVAGDGIDTQLGQNGH